MPNNHKEFSLTDTLLEGNKLNTEINTRGKISVKIEKTKRIIELLTVIGNTAETKNRKRQLKQFIKSEKKLKNKILSAETGLKEIKPEKISLQEKENELLTQKLDALIEQKKIEGVNVIGYWGDDVSIMNELRKNNPKSYIDLLSRNIEFNEEGISIEIWGGVYLINPNKDRNNIELSLIDAESYAQDRGNEIVRFLSDLYYFIPKEYVDSLFKIDKHSYYHFDKNDYNNTINNIYYKPHQKAKFLTCKKIGEGRCSSETIIK